MPKSKLTADEVQAAEMAADNRKTSRNRGFDLMSLRDQGAVRLGNGVLLNWPVPRERRYSGLAYRNVPEGHFVLDIAGQAHLFDADDFRKYLRWV